MTKDSYELPDWTPKPAWLVHYSVEGLSGELSIKLHDTGKDDLLERIQDIWKLPASIVSVARA